MQGRSGDSEKGWLHAELAGDGNHKGYMTQANHEIPLDAYGWLIKAIQWMPSTRAPCTPPQDLLLR